MSKDHFTVKALQKCLYIIRNRLNKALGLFLRTSLAWRPVPIWCSMKWIHRWT